MQTILLAAVVLLSFDSAAAPVVVGYLERARMGFSDPARGGVELSAKLDTGAQHSSLDARHIKAFERAGREWVRFEVDGDAGARTIEAPLIREAKIRRHDGPSQLRPVIRVRLCVGSVTKEVELNLIDRSGFDYPLLVGRSFLAGDVLVDSGKKFASPLVCR